MAHTDAILRALVACHAPDAILLRAEQLTGGISAQVTALKLEQPNGDIVQWVLRLHGAADRAANPNIAADEFRLLQRLYTAGLPTQRPLHLDTSGEIIAQPYLILEFVVGETQPRAADSLQGTEQMPATLAQIHRVDLATHDFAFLPAINHRITQRLQNPPAQPKDDLHETRIRETLSATWPLPAKNEIALLHGDYWPGNLLWRDDQLVAVIDWEDAALGDPLYDLANSRLEILWGYGEAAMAHFTQHYRALMPHLDYAALPHWDLYAALRPIQTFMNWAEDVEAAQIMRERHLEFVERVFEETERR